MYNIVAEETIDDLCFLLSATFIVVSPFIFMIIMPYIIENFFLTKDTITPVKETQVITKNEVKYEDKYWDLFNKVEYVEPTDIVLTEEEEQTFMTIWRKNINSEVVNINKKLLELRDDIDYIEDDNETSDDDSKEKYLEECKKEYIKLTEQKQNLDTNNEIKNASFEEFLDIKFEYLKTCYVIEKTPLGNVAMFYNIKTRAFVYYSDNVIPYRFLETVARKWVWTFKHKFLYVDMKKELELSKKKMEELEEKKKKEEEEKKKNGVKTTKDVFAKFKDYNRHTSVSGAKSGGNRQTSVLEKMQQKFANNVKTEKEDEMAHVLKEKSNRFTNEGRFSSFNILKKIDRKIVDKRYGTSYSDFKRMQKDKQFSQLKV